MTATSRPWKNAFSMLPKAPSSNCVPRSISFAGTACFCTLSINPSGAQNNPQAQEACVRVAATPTCVHQPYAARHRRIKLALMKRGRACKPSVESARAAHTHRRIMVWKSESSDPWKPPVLCAHCMASWTSLSSILHRASLRNQSLACDISRRLAGWAGGDIVGKRSTWLRGAQLRAAHGRVQDLTRRRSVAALQRLSVLYIIGGNIFAISVISAIFH